MFEKRWLKEGSKTKITNFIKEIAETIPDQDLKLIENISKYISSINPGLRDLKNIKFPDKRLRSATQLLKKHAIFSHKRCLISGCIEVATIFRTLCIAKGIPAVFIETLRKEWIDSPPNKKNPTLIEGHVFVDVFIKNKWHTINPGSRNWLRDHKDYSISGKGSYLVIGKGRDSADLGFSNMKIFRKWVAKKFKKPHLLF